MSSQTAGDTQQVQFFTAASCYATKHLGSRKVKAVVQQCLLTGRLAAAEVSAWATGLAVATEGGVVAAPDCLPKKDEMSRCFMLALATATLLTLMIWLSRSLYARLSVITALSIEKTSTPL
jgi:hypothetical protein